MSDFEKESIFFATSFSGHVDYENNNMVHDDFKLRIETLLMALRSTGRFDVHCAVESEGWRVSDAAPGVSMASNYAHIRERGRLVALVDEAGSDGRGLEVMYAISQGKQVTLITGPGEKLSYAMRETVALGQADYLPYESPEELAQNL